MSHFEWTEKLNTHVEIFNDEHRELIKLMNNVYDASHEKKSYDEIKQKLDALVTCAVNHFEHEEEYMRENEDEGLAEHTDLHDQLRVRFEHYIETFETEKQMPDNFFNFLDGWLLNHIAHVDKKYGPSE